MSCKAESACKMSQEVANILGIGIVAEIGWLVSMFLVSFGLYLWKWTDDKQKEYYTNPVLAYIMNKKYGYEKNFKWRGKDDSLYKSSTGNAASDGEGAYFYGHWIIFLITVFAVIAYKLPIATLVIFIIFGSLFGARSVKRLNKKVVKLETGNDYTDGL